MLAIQKKREFCSNNEDLNTQSNKITLLIYSQENKETKVGKIYLFEYMLDLVVLHGKCECSK